jgi:Rrf2 family protein
MLSMKAKYTLKALIAMAEHDDLLLSSRTVATTAHIPHKFLDLILQELRQWGYIQSVRGIHGGYSLAKRADSINLGDLIRKVDGPLAPIKCASLTAYQKCDDCISESACQVRHLMFEVRNAIADILDKRTLSDLLNHKDILPLNS